MSATRYTVWVRTGDQNLAGTDSNVFIQLVGTAGQTETIYLPPQDIFAFESSSTDKFVLEAPDIGDVTRCCIGHDNAEGDSGWFVVDIRVQQDETGKSWTFTFNQWLGVEESGKLSECVDL